MAKKTPKPKLDLTLEKNAMKAVQEEKNKLTVNGLYLPEKEGKEGKTMRTVYYPNEIYNKMYKISQVSGHSLNEIIISLCKNVISQNSHLFKD